MIWYFIGMVNDRVIHADHGVFPNENGRNKATIMAQDLFDLGVIIQGEIVKFDRVVTISENHETALDISKAKEEV